MAEAWDEITDGWLKLAIEHSVLARRAQSEAVRERHLAEAARLLSMARKRLVLMTERPDRVPQ